MTPTELELIDRWQRDFPLVERPFAAAGRPVGLDELATLATFRRLRAAGVISRIGAVVRPHAVGASTLAAMRLPPDRLDEVAALVTREPLVTHNYERAHPINLWFVVAGPGRHAVTDTLARIETQSRVAVLDLPLVRAFRLDLAFPLTGERREPCRRALTAGRHDADGLDRQLLAAIEDGLPIVPEPYRSVAEQLGVKTMQVLDRLQRLADSGIVTRFGCVVRHRALGYTANAMAVWNVPDERVPEVGACFARHPGVTLCYQRPRRPPDWPFNLFCMVHAKTRAEAYAVIDDLNLTADTGLIEQTVLFSTRCFKQRGASFSEPKEGVH